MLKEERLLPVHWIYTWPKNLVCPNRCWRAKRNGFAWLAVVSAQQSSTSIWGGRRNFWKSGKIGGNKPESLIKTMWWLLTQHIGLRGRLEDFRIMNGDNGLKPFEFTKGLRKPDLKVWVQSRNSFSPKCFRPGKGNVQLLYLARTLAVDIPIWEWVVHFISW